MRLVASFLDHPVFDLLWFPKTEGKGLVPTTIMSFSHTLFTLTHSVLPIH